MVKKRLKIILIYILALIVIAFITSLTLTCVIKKDFNMGYILSQLFGSIFLLMVMIIAVVILWYYHKHYWLFNSKNVIKSRKNDDISVNLENSRFIEKHEMDDMTFRVEKYSNLKNIELIGTVIGAKDILGDMEVTFIDAAHSFVIGTTGSGKTTTYVNNTIQILKELKNRPSMIITDPKGELYRDHAKSLELRGYKVQVIDLRNPYNSIRWNPLARIYDLYQRAHHLDEELKVLDDGTFAFDGKVFSDINQLHTEMAVKKQLLIDTVYNDIYDISQVICPVTNKNEPMWEQGASKFIAAIAMAMLEDSVSGKVKLTKDQFTFYSIMKVCTRTDDNCKEIVEYFKGRDKLSSSVSLVKQVMDASEKTRASYLSTVFDKISIFADKSLCALTSKNEIEFESMGDVPTVLFLKIPDEKETRYVIASMVVQQAYKDLVAKAESNSSLTLNNAVYFILDEFGNMPKFDKLHKMVTVGRSRKIFLNMVLQSYTQLNIVYGEEVAKTVKGNCNIHIYIGTTDLETNEEFSKKLGNYTVIQRSVGFPTSKGEDINSNLSIKERPLIYPSELAKFNSKTDSGNAIVYFYGSKPVKTKFTASYLTHAYKLIKTEELLLQSRFFDEEACYYDIAERNKIIVGNMNNSKTEAMATSMKIINLISEVNYLLKDILTDEEIKRLENAIRSLELDEVILLLDKAIVNCKNQDKKLKLAQIQNEKELIMDFIIQNKRKNYENILTKN